MDAPPPAAAAAAETGTDSAGGGSPFLQCVSLLNDDVLTAYLVPKLVEQGSAGAVALTCSELRKLCQLSIQHLDLTRELYDANPCHDSTLARQLVDAFPNCTALEFAICSRSMSQVYHNIRPMLAGLPKLSTISIKPDSAPDSDIIPGAVLDPVLCQLHMHATGLRCLSLQLEASWVDVTDMVWASLGKMTYLTKLQLTFDFEETHPCTLTDLQLLTGLTNLQSLVMKAPGAEVRDLNEVEEDGEDAALQLAAQQFPGDLTALTELLLPLGVLHDISSVSECVRLRDLQLQACDSQWLEWYPQEWAALAQLTSLTRLHVAMDLEEQYTADTEAFYGLLRQLKELRVVGVYMWGLSSLPVLQSLTQLTAVYGYWQVILTSDLSGLSCPHIKVLGEAWDVPLQAFPNLVCVRFAAVGIADLTTLSSHCTALQKLVMPEGVPLVTGEGEFQRLAAFRGLADLQHLTHLELAPSSDAELVVFTTAAAAVSTSRLRCLRVYGDMLTVPALMQLQSVRGLKELHVHFKAMGNGYLTQEAVRMWLVGLAVVPKVFLVLGSAEQQGVFDAARQWAAERSLPLPAVLKFSHA